MSTCLLPRSASQSWGGPTSYRHLAGSTLVFSKFISRLFSLTLNFIGSMAVSLPSNDFLIDLHSIRSSVLCSCCHGRMAHMERRFWRDLCWSTRSRSLSKSCETSRGRFRQLLWPRVGRETMMRVMCVLTIIILSVKERTWNYFSTLERTDSMFPSLSLSFVAILNSFI